MFIQNFLQSVRKTLKTKRVLIPQELLKNTNFVQAAKDRGDFFGSCKLGPLSFTKRCFWSGSVESSLIASPNQEVIFRIFVRGIHAVIGCY